VQPVLDIADAFRPQRFDEAEVHNCGEPYEESMDRLNVETSYRTKFVYLRSGLDESSKLFPASSVHAIFLIDVIEHVEREKVLASLERLKRIALRQITRRTPGGFMPQDSLPDGADTWSMGGGERQRAGSGWFPNEFEAGDGCTAIACQDFQKCDWNGRPMEKHFGAT
jgi:hypothetical protein